MTAAKQAQRARLFRVLLEIRDLDRGAYEELKAEIRRAVANSKRGVA